MFPKNLLFDNDIKLKLLPLVNKSNTYKMGCVISKVVILAKGL